MLKEQSLMVMDIYSKPNSKKEKLPKNQSYKNGYEVE